jgi:EAL domain-containing protein (putative c-di-GMP-specific phosphodiesterase class I)
MFEAGMHADALDRLELEADLRRALERDEFRVFYQPIVNLEDGAIVGTEGLIRWMHPTRGVVAPQDFIPLAEETGLIVPIGRWVIEEVCRQGAKWAARAPATPHRMSVNLSPRQFQDARIVSHVRQALELSGFDAPSLTIEITESALMQDTDGNIRKLHELKDLGVLLAIDDFGTGYSSLSYLLKFPIDILKIDRSFVRNIANGTDDATLVRAILKMGNTLNLELVAEGIEDSEQVASLLGADCVLGQGFYFARPAPAEEVERRFVVKHPRARRLSMVHEGGRAEATG